MKVILHIGPHKTGTTSIQAFLHKNSALLYQHGFNYPQTRENGPNHHDLVLGLRDVSQRLATTERIQRLLKQSEAEGLHTLILSSEIFVEYGIPIRLIRKIFMDHDLRVLAYIRRPDHQFLASYVQLLREEDCRRTQGIDEDPPPYDCSYRTSLLKWIQQLDPREMVIAPFDPAQWKSGNLLLDFCHMIELDSLIHPELKGIEAPHKNKSLPVLLQELLRTSNSFLGLSKANHLALCSELDQLASEHSEFFGGEGGTLPQDLAIKLFKGLSEMLPVYRPYFRNGFDEAFLQWPEYKKPTNLLVVKD